MTLWELPTYTRVDDGNLYFSTATTTHAVHMCTEHGEGANKPVVGLFALLLMAVFGQQYWQAVQMMSFGRWIHGHRGDHAR